MKKMLEEEKQLQEKEFERAFFREFWPDNVWWQNPRLLFFHFWRLELRIRTGCFPSFPILAVSFLFCKSFPHTKRIRTLLWSRKNYKCYVHKNLNRMILQWKDIQCVVYNLQIQCSQSRFHFFFFLASVLISWTGAAGILIHHSRARLTNLSLLSFLRGICLVKASTNISMVKYLIGKNARTAAMKTSNKAILSEAWKMHRRWNIGQWSIFWENWTSKDL